MSKYEDEYGRVIGVCNSCGELDGSARGGVLPGLSTKENER